MKIAIPVTDPMLGSEIDARFGRANCIMIVDTGTMEHECLSCPESVPIWGAGVQRAQALADSNVDVVISGNIGPNAFQILHSAGIEVITGVNGNVRDVIEAFERGELKSSSTPNVGTHFGTGRKRGRR